MILTKSDGGSDKDESFTGSYKTRAAFTHHSARRFSIDRSCMVELRPLRNPAVDQE